MKGFKPYSYRKYLQVLKIKRSNEIDQRMIQQARRLHDQSPVNPPGNAQEEGYVRLDSILQSGFKVPQPWGIRYAPEHLLIDKRSPFCRASKYNLITAKKNKEQERLYTLYMDESTILLREHDQQLMLFLPRSEPVAVHPERLTGLSLRKHCRQQWDLEYVYLMMVNLAFSSQFPKGIRPGNILQGWIPQASSEEQQRIVQSFRRRALREAEITFSLLDPPEEEEED